MKQEQYIWIDTYGNKCYYKDREMNIRHRIDGPAVETVRGTKFWYVDDKLHRLDGPAMIWANGDREWWVDGECFTEEQFNALTAPTLELTLEDIAIKFGVDASKVKIKK
jgi:hypothetical protein